MDHSLFVPLVTFVFVSIFTPGPNNIMLMTSGANVGFMRTIPHMLGITFGFSAMVLLVGVSLTGLFQRYPFIHQCLQVICIGYLVYLAIKIALSKSLSNDVDYKPMSFLGAILFQWVNPKAWSMVLTAVSVFNPDARWEQLMFIALIFALVNIPSTCIWTATGKQLSLWISKPAYMCWFNRCMAALLLTSLLMM